MDRINDEGGYTIDNIQLLPGPENVAKENRRRKRRYVFDEGERKMVCVTDPPTDPNEYDDIPF